MRSWMLALLLLSLGSMVMGAERQVPPLLDTVGKSHRPGEDLAASGTVILFLTPDCPLCQRYVPTLKTLCESSPKGVAFYGIVATPSVSRADVVTYAKDFGFNFPVLFDPAASYAAWLKPTHVPEAFVLNAEGKVVYRGRIDDWYIAPGKPRQVVTSHDLKNAIAAVAAGKAPEVAETKPVGCLFEEEIAKLEAAPAKVTYSRHVAPILFQHCSSCHRAGEVAPFPLMGYEDAKKRAKQVARVVADRDMPPWKAEAAHFADERKLTAQEIATLVAWEKAGCPDGDKADLPPTPKFTEGWQLGKPDLIIKMTESFTIPASGKDVLRNFVIPIDVNENKMVTAIEFRPGNRKVVHHALCFLDSTGTARKLDAAEAGPGYNAEKGGLGFLPTGGLGGWAPGVVPRHVPEGTGRLLARGSDAILQIHYHPSGKEETDLSEVGVYFAKTPPKRLLAGLSLENWNIDIPAGEKNYIRKDEYILPVNVTFVGVAPHMHLLGKEMKVWAEKPDGKVVPLIEVKKWDFNWQDYYIYRKPFTLPKGTKLKMESRHDNSADNPANPFRPLKRIRYGEGTDDEMSLAIFEVTCDSMPDLMYLIYDNTSHLKIIERFSPDPKKKPMK